MLESTSLESLTDHAHKRQKNQVHGILSDVQKYPRQQCQVGLLTSKLCMIHVRRVFASISRALTLSCLDPFCHFQNITYNLPLQGASPSSRHHSVVRRLRAAMNIRRTSMSFNVGMIIAPRGVNSTAGCKARALTRCSAERNVRQEMLHSSTQSNSSNGGHPESPHTILWALHLISAS